MDRRIGIIIIIVALIVGAMSAVVKLNNDKLISEIQNQTGSCYLDGTCLHEQSNITFIVLAIISGVMFVIGAIIIILSFDGKNEHKTTRKLNLNSEQKKLYDLLSVDGSMLQGELVQRSGMTKVTVSRILDKMEMQGVVERRRHGMSNIVVLKK